MKTTFRLSIIFLLIVTAMQSQNFSQSKDTRVSLDSIDMNDEELKDSYLDNNVVQSEMEKRFYENAKLAGLTKDKTKMLKKILEERNSVLKNIDLWKEQLDDTFNLEDRITLYTFRSTRYRNLYAKKINNLLTYQQFCYFVVDEYRDEAVENSQMDYQDLLKSNPSLNTEHKKKIYKLIYDYHLNQRLIKIYNSFDKKLQDSRLEVFRINFEKDFANICQEYGIKGVDTETNNNDNNSQLN